MAFAATVVWEVRTTGSDSNGGGFDPTSGVPGTDFSQQDAAQIAYTDLVIDATTNTKCTSAGNPFTAAHVGNIINVTGGTGFTVQRVQILSVSAGVATCDKSLGTLSSTGGTGNLGGGLATPGTANGLVVKGNVVYVKLGTYNLAATLALTGGSNIPIMWVGYNTTRTLTNLDSRPTLASNNNALIPVVNVQAYTVFRNFIIDGSGTTKAQRGILMSGTNGCYIEYCKVSVFTDCGILIQGNGAASNCLVTGGTSAASNGAINISSRSGFAINCTADSNACPGCYVSNAGGHFLFCISSNNTTSSGHGFRIAGSVDGSIIGCVAYNNAGDGLRIDGVNNNPDLVRNCIFEHNVNGINSSGNDLTAIAARWPIDYNAYYNNTSANYVQVPAGAHDLTLTGSPFTNAAGNDFSLNNTAGAGASCRAAGFPGTLQQGGTGYIDIGALQHQDSPAVSVHTDNPVVTYRTGVLGYS